MAKSSQMDPTVEVSPRRPFHEQVADQLVRQLEEGTAPWQRPWQAAPSASMFPINPTTGKRYRGVNALYLMAQGRADCRWLTYRQAQSIGAQVRKGERGTTIQYWKFSDERPALKDGETMRDTQGRVLKVRVDLERPKVFLATVFNGEQVEGLPATEWPKVSWPGIEGADRIVQASGARIDHDAVVPCYRPVSDSIHLPPRASFKSAAAYYATMLHEIGHWTGHGTRLARDLAHPFGSEGYAKEELRAEIASMLLGQELGIGHDPGQHVAYVGSWVKVLRSDPMEIFRAAADAEKIFGFVIGLPEKRRFEEALSTPNPYVAAALAHDPESYSVELSRRLSLSSLQVVDGEGYVAALSEKQVAVAFGGVARILCGPVGDPAARAAACALVASGDLGRLVHAVEHGEGALAILDAGPEQLDRIQRSTAVTRRSGSDSRPLAIVVGPGNKDLGTLLCVVSSLALALDPHAPDLETAELGEELAQGLKPSEKALAHAVRVASEHEKAMRADRSASDEELVMAQAMKRSAQQAHKRLGASSAVPHGTTASLRTAATTRISLRVPFTEKEAAKAAGAKWDRRERTWYADSDVDREALSRWLASGPVGLAGASVDPHKEFAEALVTLGCVLDGEHPIMDGRGHRVSTQQDRGGQKSAFYVGHLDGHPAGYAKDNRSGAEVRWKFKGYVLDARTRARLASEAALKQEERAAVLLRQHQEAADRVALHLRKLRPVGQPTPYLRRKSVSAGKGVFTDESGDLTCLPAIDVQGRLWTMQYIQPDGGKRFARGTRKEGCFHVGGGLEALSDAGVLLIAEGYATARSVEQAVGLPVVTAFDSGNLVAVAQALHQRFPGKPVVITGDDDASLVEKLGLNPGRDKALEAALSVGGLAVFPDFTPTERREGRWTDFNDLAVCCVDGLLRTSRVLKEALTRSASQGHGAPSPWCRSMDGAR